MEKTHCFDNSLQQPFNFLGLFQEEVKELGESTQYSAKCVL